MDTGARRAQFIAAALELYKEQGIARTTIDDISRRVGVARSLFYHYFANKQEITQAVIDDRVTDFLTQFDGWAITYDKDNTYESLEKIVSSLRTYLRDPDSFTSFITREHNDTLRHLFTVRSAKQLSQQYALMKERSSDRLGAPSMRHPQESFYVLAVGLISIMSQYPEVPDEVLIDIIADGLHINLC